MEDFDFKRLDSDALYCADGSREGFLELGEYIRNVTGRDVIETLNWIWQFRRQEDLEDALYDVWSATSLPLADWATRIADVGIYADLGEVPAILGIGARLNDMRTDVVCQQSPLNKAVVEARLRELFSVAPPRQLTELFSAAPGLARGEGLVLADRDFIFRPMDFWTRWSYGPQASYEYCMERDHEVWPKELCACELFYMEVLTPLACWVMLSRDGRPFFYMDDETEALSELNLDIVDVIEMLLLEEPENIIRGLIGNIKVSGRRIATIHSGDAVRSEYERLDTPLQIAVFILVARAVLRICGSSPVHASLERVIAEYANALIEDRAPDEEATAEAEALCSCILELSRQKVRGILLTVCERLPAVNSVFASPSERLPMARGGALDAEIKSFCELYETALGIIREKQAEIGSEDRSGLLSAILTE